MKKTFTINISGTIFHIEEDAYEMLQSYILKLKNHFGTGDEGNEIISDIESRISELFLKKSDGGKSVVTIDWVQEVIQIMGTPEDIMDAANDEEATETTKRKRRLYRDPEHKVIGGVCGGLGAYFNMDPVILRIIFAILFFVTFPAGLIAYIILWIAVPMAINTAQRLEMKGQEVTVSNIQKTIKDDVKDVQDSYAKMKSPEAKNRGEFGDFVYNFFKVVLKIFVIVVGVLLILTGFFGLLGFISSMVVGHSFVSDWPLIWSPDFHMPGFMNQFVMPGAVTFGLIAIAFLVGIPLLALLFIGTKLVFHYKSNNTLIGVSMTLVWVAALIGLLVLFATQVRNYKMQTSLSSSEIIECDSCQTLYLNVDKGKWDDLADIDIDMDNFQLVLMDGKERLIGEPRLDIEKANTDNFSIVIKKRARGSSNENAKQNIEEISYKYSLKDSTLTFDPGFLIGENSRWRDQKVDIVVKVPEGKAVFIGENMGEIIHDIDNVSNTWDGDMIGKYWIMKPDGLTMKEK